MLSYKNARYAAFRKINYIYILSEALESDSSVAYVDGYPYLLPQHSVKAYHLLLLFF